MGGAGRISSSLLGTPKRRKKSPPRRNLSRGAANRRDSAPLFVFFSNLLFGRRITTADPVDANRVVLKSDQKQNRPLFLTSRRPILKPFVSRCGLPRIAFLHFFLQLCVTSSHAKLYFRSSFRKES